MNDYQTPERMALKQKAIPLPDLSGKSVLDIGCDHGYWCQLALDMGAGKVLGLDRNRSGIDLIARNRKSIPCEFENINLGKQWHEYGKFDVAFCFSMYHHVYEACGDHLPIWFWLWRHTKDELLWENPTGENDAVVRINVSRDGYTPEAIWEAAKVYFDVEYVGPALHVPTREVWRCIPRQIESQSYNGVMTSGGWGASKAFAHADNRRIKELAGILGYEPFAGTLNLNLDKAFDWDRGYYRAELLETVNRADLNAQWLPRPVRLYPLTANGVAVHAIRFEGEDYRQNYMELIAATRLRDVLTGLVNVRS